MSIVNVFGHFVKEPVRRIRGGFMKMGADVRPADTRTTQEIEDTITYYMAQNPALEQFSKEIKDMPKRFLGTVSDTLELSNLHTFTLGDTSLTTPLTHGGQSVIEILLSRFPKVAKENPKALELTQSVIDNVDGDAAKYFLTRMVGVSPESIVNRTGIINDKLSHEGFVKAKEQTRTLAQEVQNILREEGSSVNYETALDMLNHSSKYEYRDYIRTLEKSKKFKQAKTQLDKEYKEWHQNRYEELLKEMPIDSAKEADCLYARTDLSGQIGETVPYVKDIAEASLNGSIDIDFKKKRSFINMLASLINPQANPEKIRLIKDLSEATENENVPIFIDRFIGSDTPVEQVKENIGLLPEVLHDAIKQGKEFDVVEFVNNNRNLK